MVDVLSEVEDWRWVDSTSFTYVSKLLFQTLLSKSEVVGGCGVRLLLILSIWGALWGAKKYGG
jgi:hypothetical protein